MNVLLLTAICIALRLLAKSLDLFNLDSSSIGHPKTLLKSELGKSLRSDFVSGTTISFEQLIHWKLAVLKGSSFNIGEKAEMIVIFCMAGGSTERLAIPLTDFDNAFYNSIFACDAYCGWSNFWKMYALVGKYGG